MQILSPFHSWYCIFSTQPPLQEWIPDQTDFSKKKQKKKQLTLLQKISNVKTRTLRKWSCFQLFLVVFVHVGNEHRTTSVLSSDFMSKGQVGSCGTILPCQQHSWLPHYINFLFPFKREFIQLNSFKSFIFSFLKRSICILFVLVLGGFQKSCLNFLHFQQKIKPSTKLMGHCQSGKQGEEMHRPVSF